MVHFFFFLRTSWICYATNRAQLELNGIATMQNLLGLFLKKVAIIWDPYLIRNADKAN